MSTGKDLLSEIFSKFGTKKVKTANKPHFQDRYVAPVELSRISTAIDRIQGYLDNPTGFPRNEFEKFVADFLAFAGFHTALLSPGRDHYQNEADYHIGSADLIALAEHEGQNALLICECTTEKAKIPAKAESVENVENELRERNIDGIDLLATAVFVPMSRYAKPGIGRHLQIGTEDYHEGTLIVDLDIMKDFFNLVLESNRGRVVSSLVEPSVAKSLSSIKDRP